MPDLYGVPVKMYRRDMTDEVIVDFIDKATGITYQQRGIMLPRDPTEREIIDAISRACVKLQDEAAKPPPDAPSPVEMPLPSAVINHAFDVDGPTNAVAPTG